MPAGDPDWAIEDPRYRSKAYRQHVDTSDYKLVDDAFAGGGYGPRCWNDDMETVGLSDYGLVKEKAEPGRWWNGWK